MKADSSRYLLYIDILGFSELVEEGARRLDDLFEVIASLYAHDQSEFRAIVFSDTILVYNAVGVVPDRRSQTIMFLCEFAQDLQVRLTGWRIFFRAVLVQGAFVHYVLNEIPCFYGEALIRAYKGEKQLPAIGFFMERALAAQSSVYHTVPFDEEFEFVLITQGLEALSLVWWGDGPLAPFILEGSDLIYLLVPDLLFVQELHVLSISHADERVRAKHARTLGILRSRYPAIVGWLESHGFEITSISPDADWQEVITRYPESYASTIRSRKTF